MSGIEIIISWSGGDRSLLIWLDWGEVKVSLRDTNCRRWCFDWQYPPSKPKTTDKTTEDGDIPF